MDIDRVRYFHMFAETGSIIRASEILHISQPALSKALRLLEHEIGTSLLEPEGRGLRLTPAGIKFKHETGSLLTQWLEIPKKLSIERSEEPTKIGSFEVFTTYFLGHLVNYIDLDSLELHEYGPGRLELAVSNSTIDIGITYIPIPHSSIEFTEVTKIRMGVFGLRKFKNVALGKLPFVVPLTPVEGTPSKVIGLDGWPDHKYRRIIKYRVTMMESAMELCRRGLCVAYLPSFIVDLHNTMALPEFKFSELESPIAQKDRLQSVFLIQRSQSRESSLFKKVAKSLRSLE
jgi:DNA-binding transcriptional LysR family regulator